MDRGLPPMDFTFWARSQARGGKAAVLWKKIMLVMLSAILVLAVVLVYGNIQWNSGTRELRRRIETSKTTTEFQSFDGHHLAALPPPVQRYFRAVLREGQPIVSAVDVSQTGSMDFGKTSPRWKSFAATQRVVTRRPGFDWDARVPVMPGLPVYVHDTYIAGEGILHAAVVGIVPLANLRGTGEIAQGELMRFLAEAAWYPTALLPSQGVRWDAVDDRSARATLVDGNVSVTILFGFNEEGLINTGRVEARGRLVGNKLVPTPWLGHYWNYVLRDGMRVPLDAEVAWGLPEGIKPYWRGHITRMTYEFTQ
jgi:Family of unknown function (DUF6920)